MAEQAQKTMKVQHVESRMDSIDVLHDAFFSPSVLFPIPFPLLWNYHDQLLEPLDFIRIGTDNYSGTSLSGLSILRKPLYYDTTSLSGLSILRKPLY